MDVADANVEALVDEYETLVAEAATGGHRMMANHQHRLTRLLVFEGDWTPRAAEHLVSLVRNYGSFVLRNALALALALEIEDGELGI